MRPYTIPVALLAVLGVGCVDDDSDGGILITKNVSPGTGCTFSSSESELFIPRGVWSVRSPGGYQMFPQMVSRITAAADQIDQRTIILQGARVDIEFADTNLANQLGVSRLEAEGVTKFETRFTAPLKPNGGITDGAIELITRRLIDEVAAVRPGLTTGTTTFATELLATIVVFGDLSGDEIRSQRFTFPVTLCNNCVTRNVGACPLPAGTEVNKGNSCNPFQDGTLDCCTTTTGDLMCPATVATM